MWIKIVSADYLGDYKLSVLFNDGVRKDVDFYSLFFENDYPVFRGLKDINKFMQFKVTDTLEWENGEIDVAPETVYEYGRTIN